MAMNFFRRWQKTIIITMVVLMVVFLVGVQGITMLFNKKPGQQVYATSNAGDLTYNDINNADAQMRMLSSYFNLPSSSMEFINLQARCGDNASLAYAMLSRQAQKVFPAEVGDVGIKMYLEKIGIHDAQYNSIISRAQLNNRSFSERALKDALSQWIKIVRLYEASEVSTPASEVALRKIYRDINEKIKLQMVTLDCEKFVDKVSPPDEQQISEQFAKYRGVPAGITDSAQSYGFGYLQPDAVDISWLRINREVVDRVIQPDPRDVRQYYRQHKSELTKEVPAEPDDSDQTQPSTQPDTQPAKTVTVQMDLDEAWDQIVEKLKADAVDTKMAELLDMVQQLSAQYETYQELADSLTLDASGDLNTVIPADAIASIKGKTLLEAIKIISSAARLNWICYPWDVPGEYLVKNDVKIPETLDSSNPMPLAKVLDAITGLVFAASGDKADQAVPAGVPQITWAMCKGLDAVLIPAGPSPDMNLLLYQTGKTGLCDRAKISRDMEISLANTAPLGGQSLVDLAFAAETFNPNTQTSQIKVGQAGKVMYLGYRGSMGRLLWRLKDAVKAHALEVPNDAVRRQVIDDLKLQSAFVLAADEGRKLATAAKAGGLLAAAQTAGLETKETELFSRRVLISPRQMAIMQIQQMMQYRPNMDFNNMFLRAMMMEPFAFMPSRVDDVTMPNQQVGQWFVDRLFEVAPQDPDNPGSGPVDVVPVPATHSVYVVQRSGYQPAVIGEFNENARKELSEVVSAIREDKSRNDFFSWLTIAKRFEYAPVKNKDK